MRALTGFGQRMRDVMAVAALMCAIATPGVAHAAAAREYQLQLAPAAEAGQNLLIVSAMIDAEVLLPATVTIPVPAGGTLLWSGEVLGGPVAADPKRGTTVERVGSMDVHTLTVEQARLAQIELLYPGPTISGRTLTTSLTWTNPGDEVLVSGSFVLEPGATDVKIEPGVSGETRTNSIGETLYPLGGLRLVQGGSYVMTATWKRGDAASREDAIAIIVGVLAVVVMALVIVIVRERTRARRAAREDEALDEWDDGSEATAAEQAEDEMTDDADPDR